MTTVIKPTFEIRIFINEAGDVAIQQLGSGYDPYRGVETDQLVYFPMVHLDAVIQALQELRE